MDKPKYFFSVSSQTNPRNTLDENIQYCVNDLDCFLLTDLDFFTERLVKMTEAENEKQKRTKPVTIELWYKGDNEKVIKDDQIVVTWGRENQRLISATISKVRIEELN